MIVSKKGEKNEETKTETMCFLYWHGTVFETHWQNRIYWQDRFEHPIVNLCQYMTKTEYTGKPCVNYTGTEQCLKHTGRTQYTGMIFV